MVYFISELGERERLTEEKDLWRGEGRKREVKSVILKWEENFMSATGTLIITECNLWEKDSRSRGIIKLNTLG